MSRRKNSTLVSIENYIANMNEDANDMDLSTVTAESFAMYRLIHACMSAGNNQPFFHTQEQVERITEKGFLSPANEIIYEAMRIAASNNAVISPDMVGMILVDSRSYPIDSKKAARSRRSAVTHLADIANMAGNDFETDYQSYLNMWESVTLREDTLEMLDALQRQLHSGVNLRDIGKHMQNAGLRIGSVFSGAQEKIIRVDAAYDRYWQSFDPEYGDTYRRHIPTGLGTDRYTLGGIGTGDVAVIGGPPGHGKTTAMINAAVHAALKGHKVLFFSAEMDIFQLLDVITAIVGEIDKEDLITKQVNVDDARGLVVDIAGTELYIDETPLMTIEHIERMMALHEDTDLCIIDHIHAVSTERRVSGEGELISHVSRCLKQIARAAHCAVLAAAQLNREGEDADELFMYHLKHSSQIEQLGSIILLLRRYTDEEDEWTEDDEDHNGYGLMWLRKIREAGKYKDTTFVYRVNTKTNEFRCSES